MKLLAAAFAALTGALLFIPVLFFGGDPPAASDESAGGGASHPDIPSNYLDLYQQAGAVYEIDWAVLAGIGKLECDHGRYQADGCNPPGTINSAGTRGPMQFLGSTWSSNAGQYDLDVAGPPVPEGHENQGFATDADSDGIADPWEPADAVHAAARYLHHHGAPEDYRSAILAYNQSESYVNEVLDWAETYRSGLSSSADGAAGAASSETGGELAMVRGITVHVTIAQPLDEMIAAAARDGVMLTGSGYRSTERQIELRRQHCGTSQYAVYEMPSSQCSPATARPGSSMHERGLAVDFENCSTRSTACFQWLDANAAAYGFYNLPSESWHWSSDGS